MLRRVEAQSWSGANVIKLFLSVIYGFLYLARVFVTSLEKLAKGKHSSLLQNSVIYGQKSFITFGPADGTGSLQAHPDRHADERHPTGNDLTNLFSP
jgi:hypothetical protein